VLATEAVTKMECKVNETAAIIQIGKIPLLLPLFPPPNMLQLSSQQLLHAPIGLFWASGVLLKNDALITVKAPAKDG
jgi:hypothetical protein